MEVYLLRHGVAEDAAPGTPDADRPLTAEGQRKLQHTLQLASQVGVEPSLILTSPLKRTVQTARIAKEVLKYKGEMLHTKALAPGSAVEEAWEEIRRHRDQSALLLVGHNPQFAELAGYLVGAPEMQIDFKKGAIFRVDIPAFSHRPRGTLRWYLISKFAPLSQK